MDAELKRSLMLDNYNHPFHRGLIEDDSYVKINTNNASCIDNIDLMVKIESGKIVDVLFDGEACVICISSTSVMAKLLLGKTLEEAQEIIDNYFKMIDEEEYDENILGEALIYNEVYKQPSRKKCATLTWRGMQEVIQESK